MEYDRYIDQQIRKTRGTVKLVDLASRTLIAVVGLLAVLFAAALIEHWLVPGGLSILWRSLVFGGLVLASGWYVWRQILPLVLQRISPVYAARTIESHSPGLKNSLLNLLLFRQHRDLVPETVYRTVEEQAATRLATADVDTAVDRSGLIRVGYVLLCLVLLAGLYKVFSPKDPVATAGRVLMPWADIPVPTRVAIDDIQPGENVRIARGETVEVSANVAGLREGESVTLRYTTQDGQAIDLPVDMIRGEGEYRFRGRLPAEPPAGSPPGVQQPMTYFISAGDARSKVFAIDVIDSPTIVIERLEYDYPDYTGRADRTQPGEGNVRAIEGTRVTVHAQTNHPIQRSGIDLGADGSTDLPMVARQVDPRRASGEMLLQLDPEQRTQPYDLYALRFTDQAGHRNRQPVHYRIEIIPDLRPEVEILQPMSADVEVRLGESVEIVVEARDPDYALASVKLMGRRDERLVFDEPLLEEEHVGRFTKTLFLRPEAPEFAVGDVVEYWIEVEDVRSPVPNRTATQTRRLRIIEPPPVKDHPALADPGQGGGTPQPQAQQPSPGGDHQDQADGGATAEPQQNPNDAAGGEAQQQGGGSGEPQEHSAEQDAGNGEQARDATQDGPQQDGAQRPQDGGASGAPQQPQPGQEGQSQGRGPQDGADPIQSGKQGPGQGQDLQNGQQGGTPDPGTVSGPGSPGAPEADQTPPQPVPSDGSDDATAMQRMREHFQNQGSQNQGDRNQREPATEPSADRSGGAQNPTSERPLGPNQGDRHQAAGSEQQSQQAGRQEKQQGKPPQDGVQQPAEQQPATPPNGPKGEAGTGSEATPRDQAQEPNANDSPPSRPNETQGQPGAGNQQQNGGGAPEPLNQPKPREKTQQRGSENDPQEPSPEPPAPADGKHESNSRGDQGGDRAGGGSLGGGQNAPREGTGSPGQKTSADEGDGSSAEKGKGATSTSPGAGQQAAEQSGQPGDQEGQGSGQREGRGSAPGGKPSEAPSGDPRQLPEEGTDTTPRRDDRDDPQQPTTDPQQPRPQEGRQSDATGRPVAGNPTGGGLPGDGSALPPPPPAGDAAPVGDEGNLQYAEKQTDLILERLEDQLKQRDVDQDLIDKLGWTEDDLRRFVDRWRNLKQAAQREGADSAAQRELDKALRALGLSRRPVSRASGTVPTDQDRNVRDAPRIPVPVEWQDEARAYTRGISESD